MSRRTITGRQRRAGRVTSLAGKNADKGGLGLVQRMEHLLLTGEVMPDWTFVIVLLARLITDCLENVLLRDKLYYNKRLLDAEMRKERDQLARLLRAVLVAIRRAAAAVLGKQKAATLIAVDGSTPDTKAPRNLIGQGRHAVMNLDDPELNEAQPEVSGFGPPDPEQWKADIEEAVDNLEEIQKKIDGHRGEAKGALGERDEEINELDFVVSHGTLVLRGLFYLADMEEVAKAFAARRQYESGPRRSGGGSRRAPHQADPAAEDGAGSEEDVSVDDASPVAEDASQETPSDSASSENPPSVESEPATESQPRPESES